MADKLTKKELEQPDEFHTMGWRALQYLSEHRDRFYLGGAIILLLIIAVGGWYFYRVNYEEKAQNLYSAAYATYAVSDQSPETMRGLYLKAIGMYNKLLETHPSSHAAKLCYYTLGNLYFKVDNIEKSIESYDTFLKRFKNDDMLIALTYQGLGYCYEDEKDYDNALRNFQASTDRIKGTQIEYMNYVSIARVYEKMGNNGKSLEYYRSAAGKTNNPVMEMLITNRIASLTSKSS